MDRDEPLSDAEFATAIKFVCHKSGIDPHSALGNAFSLMTRASFNIGVVTRFLALEHAEAGPELRAFYEETADNAFALALLRERGLRS